MAQPHFTLTITASAVAWYAAILSTVGTTLQLAHYFRDRIRLKIKYRKNMEIFGDPLRSGMTFTAEDRSRCEASG